MAAQERTYGATWADLGIAIVDFARLETGKFLLVLVTIGIIGVILLFLYPRATAYLRQDYQTEISKQERGGK